MTFQFEQKFTLVLLVIFLVLTAIGILLYQTTVSSQQAMIWDKRTQEINSVYDDIARLTLDANYGVDSFVLLGNATYLDVYENAKTKTARDISLLKTSDELAARAADIGALEELIRANDTRLAYKIALRQSQGYDVAVLELSKAEDRTTLLNIRAAIERGKAYQTDKLRTRELGLETLLSRTATVLVIGSVAGLAALGFANFVVFRETSKRSAAEKALVEANRGLEQRVDERTAELQSVNAELRRVDGERAALLSGEQKARREAEVANRLRDEFMATVSHELRTPLNSILGWTRLLRQGTLSPSQKEKAVETIINSAEIQNKLIEDLLDVARIVSGKLDLDRQEFELIETVAGTIDAMEPAAAARKIELRFEHTAAPIFILADKNRIEQVLLNLLTNAVKFSPDGSRILVRVQKDESQAEISVLDQGAGIKPEFLPLVFDRFRQDESTAAGSGGLGLGLAIVRNLVEMHGGTISVKSEGENRGSEFTVRLPLVIPPDAETEAENL